MLVLAVCAGLLAVAGIVQAVRSGVRRGDWLPVGLLCGAIVAAALYCLWAATGGGGD